MNSSIRPLSEVPRDLVVEYLLQRGFSAEMVHWKFYEKYADARSRERGLSWVRGNRVDGFLGLIPTSLGRDGRTLEMAWTCDWSLRDRTAAPGIGIRMLKRAMELSDQLMYVTSGSDYTASIAPRLAHHTVPDAAALLLVPLRSGALLDWIGRRLPALRLDRWPVLPGVPLRSAGRPAKSVRTEPGVATAITPLLAAPAEAGWYPHYEWDYVDWVVGRCPELECCTVYGPSSGSPRAAALLWRRRDSGRYWRMALWARPDAAEPLRHVVSEAVRVIHQRRGWAIGLMLSRLDKDLIAAVTAGRWVLRRPRQPLFVLATKNPEIDEIGHLSYLDADLAYQFGSAGRTTT